MGAKCQRAAEEKREKLLLICGAEVCFGIKDDKE